MEQIGQIVTPKVLNLLVALGKKSTPGRAINLGNRRDFSRAPTGACRIKPSLFQSSLMWCGYIPFAQAKEPGQITF